MIRRWLLVHHPDLWATGLPAMLAAGGLLALLAAAFAWFMPLDLRDLRDPTPLFVWASILSGGLTIWFGATALLRGDRGPFRQGASGWTAVWALALGLAVLSSAPFVLLETYEARLRVLVPGPRLLEVGETFAQVAAERRFRAVVGLLRARMDKREEFLAKALGTDDRPDGAAAGRLLDAWARVPPPERTPTRALRVVGEEVGWPTASFERVLDEFGPGLDAEFDEERADEEYRGASGFRAEQNLLRLQDAWLDDEPSHPGEVVEVRVTWAAVLLWLTLAIALGRQLGLGLAAGAAGGLAFTWLGSKILLPIVGLDDLEAPLWLGLWAVLGPAWLLAFARRRRTPLALGAFAVWLLLVPFLGFLLLQVFEHDEEVWTPLAAAGLGLPLLLAPALQVVLNRFRCCPEGAAPGRASGARARGPNRLQEWIAANSPTLREDRYAGIAASGLGLGLASVAYALSLPASSTAPPSYEATTVVPWLLGLLLVFYWGAVLVRDAAALPVRPGSAGWSRLPLLALAFAGLVAAPFLASEAMDARLRSLAPADRVAADWDRLEAFRGKAWVGPLRLLYEWREDLSAAPSRVQELAESSRYDKPAAHDLDRAARILEEWRGVPASGRTRVAAARVLGRHGLWVSDEVPWRDLLATYGGEPESILAEASGTGSRTWNWSQVDANLYRFTAAHHLGKGQEAPLADRDALCAWIWVAMVATLAVAGVRAVGLRWMVTALVALGAAFLLAGVALGMAHREVEGSVEDLVTLVVLGASAVCLGLSAGILRHRRRTWRLCLLLAVGLLGAPFLSLLFGMSFGVQDPDGGVPLAWIAAGNALLLLASPALQALLNVYRASPGDGPV